MNIFYVCRCGRTAEVRTTREGTVEWLCPNCFIKLRGQDWWKEYVRLSDTPIERLEAGAEGEGNE